MMVLQIHERFPYSTLYIFLLSRLTCLTRIHNCRAAYDYDDPRMEHRNHMVYLWDVVSHFFANPGRLMQSKVPSCQQLIQLSP